MRNELLKSFNQIISKKWISRSSPMLIAGARRQYLAQCFKKIGFSMHLFNVFAVISEKNIGRLNIVNTPAIDIRLAPAFMSIGRARAMRFLFVILSGFLCTATRAASFDCNEEKLTHVERMICTSDQLQLHDSDMDAAYRRALLTAQNSNAVLTSQLAWLQRRNACKTAACLSQAYLSRTAALLSVRKAGWRDFHDAKSGLHFRYLGNRLVNKCPGNASGRCFTLTGPGLSAGSSYFVQIDVVDGSLEAAAASVWEKEDGNWVASGRGGSRSDVSAYVGEDWRGLVSDTICGIGDTHGFHGAAGDCFTYVMSNGKRSVVMTTDGASGGDAATIATIRSVKFD